MWFGSLSLGKTAEEELFMAQQRELLLARTSEKEGFLEKRKKMVKNRRKTKSSGQKIAFERDISEETLGQRLQIFQVQQKDVNWQGIPPQEGQEDTS